jgi:alpha-tubulin suppressor-like RCC1 family protein
LDVYPFSPTILSHPTNQEVVVGQNVTLTVTAVGAQLRYAWRFNGVPIVTATNSALTLTGIQASGVGIYTVVVSNTFDTAVSQPAVITVVPHRNVIAWGFNDFGQTNVPSNLTNAVAIAAGPMHALALRADGSVVGWGANNSGQLNIPVGLSNVTAIAAGWAHNLALSQNGTVIGWGDNTYGQTLPPTDLSNVVGIACGDNHSLAVKGDGTVVGWGYNADGQCNPPAGLSNVVAIAAGSYSSLALKADGTIVTWGEYYGDSSAVSNITRISASGGSRFLLLQSTGAILRWGWPPPILTQEGPTNAIAVAAGWSAYSQPAHSLAIVSNRTVRGWGPNAYGQTNPPANLSNVVAIAAGYGFSLALVRTPEIMTQPAYQTAVAGGDVIFKVEVFSVGPVSYQWRLNGADIQDATNGVLVLNDVKMSNEGVYSVKISNPYGSIVSSPAALALARLSLSLDLRDNSVSVVWPISLILQSSTNVLGPYLDITGYSGHYTNAVSSSQERYFRLRLP